MDDLKVFYSRIPFATARCLFNVGSDKLDWETGEVLSTFCSIDTRIVKMQTLHAELVHTFDAQMKASGSSIQAADFDYALKKNLVDTGTLKHYLNDVQAYQYLNDLPVSDDRSDELVILLVQTMLLAQLVTLQTVCVATAKNAPSGILNEYTFGLVDTWEGYARYQVLSSTGDVVCYDIALGDLVAFWPTDTWDRFYDYGIKALLDQSTTPLHLLNFTYAGVAMTKTSKIVHLRDVEWPIGFTNFKQLYTSLKGGTK